MEGLPVPTQLVHGFLKNWEPEELCAAISKE